MKRRIVASIRARLIAAQRQGHYTKAATIKKQLAVIKSLSVREPKHAS